MTENPQQSIVKGKVAPIPFVTGLAVSPKSLNHADAEFGRMTRLQRCRRRRHPLHPDPAQLDVSGPSVLTVCRRALACGLTITITYMGLAYTVRRWDLSTLTVERSRLGAGLPPFDGYFQSFRIRNSVGSVQTVLSVRTHRPLAATQPSAIC